MNNQPYKTPEQTWPPRMWPWWFKAGRFLRQKGLKEQQLVQIEVRGLEHLRSAMQDQHGVLITPNHSFHWDSYCLLEAADQVGSPFYIMTAWQVFAMSKRFECLSMQWSGCFSIDRESTDMTAMKTAVDIMQHRPHPLVIFPEGDIYHTNDQVTPFRDGAAAMALMAARKAERPIVALPVALKRWYLNDPTDNLLATAARLEERLFWRARPDLPLAKRIYRLAEGLLALKELEHLHAAQTGTIPERIQRLASHVLEKQEQKHDITKPAALVPERVKEVRRRIIKKQEDEQASDELRRQLAHEMDDMFFVTQLYSYPGDYLTREPSRERLAETLDKLEEDVFNLPYPSVRGPKRVVVQFGEPIVLPREKEKKLSPADLTDQLEGRVQGLLDQLNAEYAGPGAVASCGVKG